MGVFAALSAVGYSALAGSASYNFDTDPTSILNLYGNAQWYATGGNPSTGGFLSITDAVNSQRSGIVFDDFDNGLVVKAFTFSMDVRIGGGTDSPADGVSINYVRANDPVLPSNGGDVTDGWATGPNGEGDLPEEGSTTGLGIGFDAWYSGGDGSWNNNGQPAGPAPLTDDVIGVSVRLDGNLVYQFAMPTKNGALTDTTSLQTGPQNPNRDPNDITTSWALLGWAPLTASLAEDGTLTVTYKGANVTPPGGLKTTFAPSAGRLVFVGRTGNANQNNHVDNIKITTVPATTPTLGPVAGTPNSFTGNITDVAAAGINISVDPASIQTSFNGAVLPNTASKSGLVTTFTVSTAPNLIPAGSTNVVSVNYKDTLGNAYTGSRTFIEGPYTIVPASLALPAGAVNTAQRGFKVFPYESVTGHNNQIGLAEEELQGWLGPNVADLTQVNASGYFLETGVINYAKISAGDGQQGNFGGETELPGFPNTQNILNGYDNAVEDIQTFLQIPAAGAYTFGVSSDDGFRLTFGDSAPEKLTGLNVGQYDGGRGSSIPGTLFSTYFPSAGFYPARLLWFNGGGGANVEWFSIGPDGTYNLINDTGATNGANAIKAYASSSVVYPYVDAVRPDPALFAENSLVSAQEPITVVLGDGSSDVINQGSIVLTLNGTTLHPTITKNGTKTTATVNNLFPNLLPVGTNTVSLTYSAGSKPPVTASWQFKVGKYGALDPNTAVPISAADTTKPGFNELIWQIDPASGTPGTQPNNRALNLVEFAEQELLGLFGGNVAGIASYAETGVINYDCCGTDGNFTVNNGYTDQAFPGIPGNPVNGNSPTENFALSFQTWVAFPTAGFYTFGFNSDDGFATYNSTAPGPIFGLNINSPASIAGAVGAVSGGTDEGGIATPLPLGTGLKGKVVYSNPPLADSDIVNTNDVKGNIVLIDRGVSTFTDKLNRALAAGAIGVIVVNNRDNNTNTPADGLLPIVMSGTAAPGIPAVMITLADGAKIKAHLSDANGVNVTLGQDPTPRLGYFNGGRGSSDTIYSFTVPTAGVYPLRTVYFQGGGGGNAEWFNVQSDGTKVLLNDSTVATALKTYRAVTAQPKPTLSVSFNGTAATITFTGTLQWSSSPAGPFADVSPAAVSPLTVTLTSATPAFYRSRN